MFCVYSGLLYQKTDNMLSLVSGISSLNSWTRRFCLVLERGHPSVLELALFNIKDDDSMRPVCPTSVMLCYVAPGMKAVHDPRWFSPKDFTFVVQGDRQNNCHYGTNSALKTQYISLRSTERVLMLGEASGVVNSSSSMVCFARPLIPVSS